MSVRLDHTIIAARDQDAAARFLSEILGLPPPSPMAHFSVVKVGDTSLDFSSTDDTISSRHFAFRVDAAEFDAMLDRVRGRGLTIWADPGRSTPGKLYDWNGDRGFYFESPDGHLLEVLTRKA